MITEGEYRVRARLGLVKRLRKLGVEKMELAGKLAGVAETINLTIEAIERIDRTQPGVKGRRTR